MTFKLVKTLIDWYLTRWQPRSHRETNLCVIGTHFYLFWMISWDFTMFRRKFTSQFIDSTISIIRGNNHQLSWVHLRDYDRVLLLSEQPKLNRLVDQYIWLQENFVNSCLPRLCVAIFLNNQVRSVNIMFTRGKNLHICTIYDTFTI